METFTFLDRNANRDVALAWKEWVTRPGAIEILPCELRDLQRSWEYFRRSDLHKLSAVDATNFIIMKRARIRLAYAFDHHFAVVGFRMVTYFNLLRSKSWRNQPQPDCARQFGSPSKFAKRAGRRPEGGASFLVVNSENRSD